MLLRVKSFEEWFHVLLLLWSVGSIESGLHCPPLASQEDCQVINFSENEYFFKIGNDKSDLEIIYDTKYFHLKCLNNNITLESKFLPTFDKLETFSTVILSKCPLPSHSYRETLLALNISVRSILDLTLRGDSKLEAKLFESLNISALNVEGDEAASTLAEPTFLAPLSKLEDLRLTRVRLDHYAVPLLPPALSILKLERTGVERLPSEVFERLGQLKSLILSEERLRSLNLSAAVNLNDTEIEAPVDGLTLGPALHSLWLRGARGLELHDCSGLRELHVQESTAPLPGGWLEGCAVREVQVNSMNVSRAAGEWRGAGALESLDMRYCQLRDLPEGWLDDAVNLETLNLSYNNIEYLPRGLFSRTKRLVNLNLANNRLRSSAVAALGSLFELRWLSLQNNPLDDLCQPKTADVSPLKSLMKLEKLSLRRTGATVLCLDWRVQLLRLAELDLRDNNITDLTYGDVCQWTRLDGISVNVDMRGSKITSLAYEKSDYDAVKTAAPSALAQLDADWALSCNCYEYWTARALQERREHAPVLSSVRCEAGPLLTARPLPDFTCTLPADRCLPGCACVASPVHTELRCAAAGLRRLPRPATNLPPVTVLHVPGNNITLRPRDLAFLANVTDLDLSNNSISTIDAETAGALFAEGRRVSLAGNPLRCDCEALALLRAVALRPARVADSARCADGTALRVAAERAVAACVSTPVWPAAAVGALLLLLLPAALLAVVLARPAVRARLKLFLFERGLCLRWLLRAEPDDDDARPYDAFVSFSHLDSTYAAELAARLEGAGRRLCLHERDWTPGDWIPAQIARSVRDARRTVVLVSENFLRSEWALAELREAYGAALGEARPRLLVVLLPGFSAAAAAAAAPELRSYLAAVTYLRWDDSHFWSRLKMALPSRAPASPPSPAPLPPAPQHKPTAAAA
ncbi:protein toll-like [Aricia agestis]|uniref:protein toll-like n=1 Tax=Aricia agestis TaxID=91739 RepID=UPI001C209236|nr:protein toll-like [Aricia agestis]